MPVECSKLTCFAKVKIRHGSRAVRSTIEVGRCQSSFAYCEAEFDLGKGENRSKATYPHWKDETITIIDRRIRIHTCTSQRVKVKSTFGGPPCMRRSSASTFMVALQVGTQLICWPWEGLQLGWSTVLPLAVGSWATIQGPCVMHAQTTALVDGEASARRSKKNGGVPAYGKDSTKRSQLWGSFRRFG